MSGAAEASPFKRVIGYLMVAVGALWMLLSGGCTVLGVLYGLADVAATPTGIVLSVMLGCASTFAGFVLLMAGLEMRRRTPPDLNTGRT